MRKALEYSKKMVELGELHYHTLTTSMGFKQSFNSCLEIYSLIVHFTVVCLVAKPLNRNEGKGDLVMIQTLLLFKCKLLCYHANWILVSITTRSPSASLQIKGLATKYTTVKWPVKLFMCNTWQSSPF